MKSGKNYEATDKLQTTFDGPLEENVLVISAARNKVILPYSLKELQKSLHGESGCADLRQLIEKNYTVPLSRYKHGCISRFKEVFILVRVREKESVFKALDLAYELFFKKYLHPAIITACKCRDWLDVYLDCLDKNELDDFPFFGIRYEPNVPQKNHKFTAG